jgi:hypothetical protein
MTTQRQTTLAEVEDGSIDAGLLLLGMVTPRGVTWTQDEIAKACGCSRAYIYLLETSAREKLRREFERRGFRAREENYVAEV